MPRTRRQVQTARLDSHRSTRDDRRIPKAVYDVRGFEQCGILGEGTYGIVSKAVHKASGTVVAIKETRQEFDMRTEAEFLILLRHGNIIQLFACWPLPCAFLVFEACDKSLAVYIDTMNLAHSTDGRIEHLTRQLLEGLLFIHDSGIAHCDIKPNNLLINHRGLVLKIADFGIAMYVNVGPYIQRASLSYRPPDVFYGAEYGTDIDMWSVGCVLAEMILGHGLFVFWQPVHFSRVALATLGVIPGMYSFWKAVPERGPKDWPQITRDMLLESSMLNTLGSPQAGSLVLGLLQFNPVYRLSAFEALDHPYLNPISPASSMFLDTPRDSLRAVPLPTESVSRSESSSWPNTTLSADSGDASLISASVPSDKPVFDLNRQDPKIHCMHPSESKILLMHCSFNINMPLCLDIIAFFRLFV